MTEYLERNEDYIVAVKPPMLCSEETPDGKGFCNLLAADAPGFLAPVYRLDKGVGGVMLYARQQAAAAFFSELVRRHALEKEYVAVLCGEPEAESGRLEDLLFFDRRKNKAFVASSKRNGVKEAVLHYSVLRKWADESGDVRTLVSVRLETGRTHQIRVQFASRGLPLLGDRRYGGAAAEGKAIYLWCRSVALPAYRTHPAVVCRCEAPFA